MDTRSSQRTPLELHDTSTTVESSRLHIARAHPPAIDTDVFRVILACLPYPELVKVSLASRSAREEAIRELLMRPVRLTHNERLRAFCEFALAGHPGRLSYLRRLTVEHIERPYAPEDQHAFARVLAHCPNLVKLELRWCDGLLLEDLRVPEAIAALTSLKHFSAIMYKDQRQSQALLLRIAMSTKSSLRSLHLPMIEDGLSKVDILQDLASTHGALEEFTLQFTTFTPPAATFHAVRVLHLTCEQTVPRVQDLHATFPNVRELTIEHHILLDDPPAPRAPSSQWQSLDLLRASALLIDTLGIACPVRRLDLNYYLLHEHARMADIVARLHPRQFTLNNYCANDWAPPPSAPSILFQSGGAGDSEVAVKHFFLKLTFSRGRAAPGTQDLADSVLPFLYRARVELLHVAVAELFNSDDPDDIVNPRIKVHPDQSDPGLPDVDVDALAQMIAAGCSSIRTVVITIALQGHTVWSVERVNGETVLAKLGAYEGRRMLERETKRCLED